MVDRLKHVIRGNELVINNNILVRNPTIDEICEYGEAAYFNLIYNVLAARPYDYMVQLWDMGVDYETVSDFQMFQILCSPISASQSNILIPNIDFTKFSQAENPANNELVWWNPDDNIVIDAMIYYHISEYIRATHFISSDIEYKVGNKTAKKFLIERTRRKQLQTAAKEKSESVLANISSSLINTEGFKYDYASVWGLHISQFFESARRIAKIKHYDQMMFGAYSGNVDLSNISKSDLDWMGSLK